MSEADQRATASAAPRIEAEPAPGEVLPLTRVGIGLLVVLAIANGLFLYLFPSQAESDYAWAIVPPVSAAFIGAGYCAGILATVLSVASRTFAPVRPLIPGLCVLAVVSFVATMIHADRFRWDYPATWLWTAVYAFLPLLAGYLWLRQRRSEPGGGDGRTLQEPLRTVTLGLGVALIAIAAVLFVAPDAVLDEWPWPITPLLSRVFSGWFALAGVALAYSALTISSPRDGAIAYATALAWAVLVLLLPLLYESDVDTDAAGFWPWIGLFAVLGLACGWALALAFRSRGAVRS